MSITWYIIFSYRYIKIRILLKKLLNKLEFDSKLINEVCKYDIDIFFSSDDLGAAFIIFPS